MLNEQVISVWSLENFHMYKSFRIIIIIIIIINQTNVRHSMQPDEDLNRSKPVVTIGLSRVISLLLVLI